MFVVGVHLHRKTVVGVDNLHQDGELVAETCVVGFAHEVGVVYLQHFVEVVFGQKAVLHHRLVAFHARQNPHLTAVGQRRIIYAKLVFNPVSTPYFVLEKWIKLQRVQCRFFHFFLYNNVRYDKNYKKCELLYFIQILSVSVKKSFFLCIFARTKLRKFRKRIMLVSAFKYGFDDYYNVN